MEIIKLFDPLRSVKRKIRKMNNRVALLENDVALCLPENKYPDYLKRWFYKTTGEYLNLERPLTYNEKIQYLKLYEKSPLKTQMADKYEVRSYIEEKIGKGYLIPLIGVYDSFDDIDFDTLPNQFALKCNHGSGYNIICKDKAQFDKQAARKQVNEWMSTNYAFLYGLELQYADVKPKIVIEEFISNRNGEDLIDYKFWCFGGKAHFVQCSSRNQKRVEMIFYDLEWNRQDFYYVNQIPYDFPKPDNLDEMIELAERLSKGFPHIRVDLYRMDDGHIYFGEFTFTSRSGICPWKPAYANRMMGDLIKLERNDGI